MTLPSSPALANCFAFRLDRYSCIGLGEFPGRRIYVQDGESWKDNGGLFVFTAVL